MSSRPKQRLGKASGLAQTPALTGNRRLTERLRRRVLPSPQATHQLLRPPNKGPQIADCARGLHLDRLLVADNWRPAGEVLRGRHVPPDQSDAEQRQGDGAEWRRGHPLHHRAHALAAADPADHGRRELTLQGDSPELRGLCAPAAGDVGRPPHGEARQPAGQHDQEGIK